MSERLLIVDAGTIQNLHAAGGPQAWGQLLKAGYRVVLPKLPAAWVLLMSELISHASRHCRRSSRYCLRQQLKTSANGK